MALFVQNKDNNEKEIEDEIETLQCMYPDQVKISTNPLQITCIIKHNTHALQAIFTKSSNHPNDPIDICVSNDTKAVHQYPKKSLQKLKFKLIRIYNENMSSMPIYNCVSYLNDSLQNISKSKPSTKPIHKPHEQKVEKHNHDDNNNKVNKYKHQQNPKQRDNKSNNRFRFKHKNMKNMTIDDGYDYLFAYNHKHYVKDAVETDEYVLFYKDVFSQWFPAKMIIDNITYANCEQYMMAEKAKLFCDKEYWDLIMEESDPSKIKKLGRCVRGFKEQKWLKHREQIVYRANLAKFTQNEILRRKLLSYDEKLYFVEASGVDKIWGIGIAVNNPAARHKRNWNGLNLLGRAITKVRDDIIRHNL